MDKVKEAVSKITGKSKLPTAKLGKNGPHVNRIGYGTMGLVSLTSRHFEARQMPAAHLTLAITDDSLLYY